MKKYFANLKPLLPEENFQIKQKVSRQKDVKVKLTMIRKTANDQMTTTLKTSEVKSEI